MRVLGILEPTIAPDLHWSETEYGTINPAFQIGYVIMMPLVDRLIDWLGLCTDYAISTLLWSLSSMAHVLAKTGAQFGIARLGLDLGGRA